MVPAARGATVVTRTSYMHGGPVPRPSQSALDLNSPGVGLTRFASTRARLQKRATVDPPLWVDLKKAKYVLVENMQALVSTSVTYAIFRFVMPFLAVQAFKRV